MQHPSLGSLTTGASVVVVHKEVGAGVVVVGAGVVVVGAEVVVVGAGVVVVGAGVVVVGAGVCGSVGAGLVVSASVGDGVGHN